MAAAAAVVAVAVSGGAGQKVNPDGVTLVQF